MAVAPGPANFKIRLLSIGKEAIASEAAIQRLKPKKLLNSVSCPFTFKKSSGIKMRPVIMETIGTKKNNTVRK